MLLSQLNDMLKKAFPVSNNNESIWKEIKFSTHLNNYFIDAAQNHVDFLADINEHKDQLVGDIIDKAIYRYEELWLPMYGKCKDGYKIYPPLDVAWIWHCHLLSPTDYIKDCENIVGRVLFHESFSRKERHSITSATEELLKKEGSLLTYDFMDENSVNMDDFKNFKSKINYDLKKASARQFEFFYNVSLPHFKHQAYLKIALDRYKKFLYLKKLNPSTLVVPCYTIDLMWHTHQLYPQFYSNDTTIILGKIFPHDDSINDRTPGGLLDISGEKTKKLWQETFNEEFFLPGAMYRGDAPSINIFSSNDTFDRDIASAWLYTYGLAETKIELRGKNKDDDGYFIINDKYQARVSCTDYHEFTYYKEYSSFPSCDEKVDINVKYIEKSKVHKLKNILKHHSKLDPSLEFNFVLKLERSLFEILSQSFDNEISSSHCDDLILNTIWKSRLRPLNSKFQFVRENFEKIDMNVVKHEYKNFELDKMDFSQTNSGYAMRCKHLIQMDNTSKENLFSVEILHMIQKQWSGIKILKQDQLRASSHFIGISQLPIDKQIGKSTVSGISLAKFEKAMLVKNLNGDFAIVKGKWTGLQRKIDKSGKSKPGNPGQLSITYYLCKNNSMVQLKIPKSFIFELKTSQILATVDLKTGKIVFKYRDVDIIDPLEADSLLALIFSISTLHVILQPKTKPVSKSSDQKKSSIQPKETIEKIIFPGEVPNRRSRRLYNPYDDYLLLESCGYYDILCCGYFPCYCDEDNFECDENADFCDDLWLFNETQCIKEPEPQFHFDFDEIGYDNSVYDSAYADCLNKQYVAEPKRDNNTYSDDGNDNRDRDNHSDYCDEHNDYNQYYGDAEASVSAYNDSYSDNDDYCPSNSHNGYGASSSSNDYGASSSNNDYGASNSNNDYEPSSSNNDYEPSSSNNDYGGSSSYGGGSCGGGSCGGGGGSSGGGGCGGGGCGGD